MSTQKTLELHSDTWVPEKARQLCHITSSLKTMAIDVRYRSGLDFFGKPSYSRALVVVGLDQRVEEIIALLRPELRLNKEDYCVMHAGRVLAPAMVVSECTLVPFCKVLLIPTGKHASEKRKRDADALTAVDKVSSVRKTKRKVVLEKPQKVKEMRYVEGAEYEEARERARKEVELRLGKAAFVQERNLEVCKDGSPVEPAAVAAAPVEEQDTTQIVRAMRTAFMERMIAEQTKKVEAEARKQRAVEEAESRVDAVKRILEGAIVSGNRSEVMGALAKLSEATEALHRAELGEIENDPLPSPPEGKFSYIPERSFALLPLSERSMRTKHGNYLEQARAERAASGQALGDSGSAEQKKHSDDEWYRCWTNYETTEEKSGESKAASVNSAPVSAKSNVPGYSILKKSITAANKGYQLGSELSSSDSVPNHSEEKKKDPPSSGTYVYATSGGGSMSSEIESGPCPLKYGDNRKSSHSVQSASSWWDSWCVGEQNANTQKSPALPHVGVPWSALGGRPIGG